MKVSIGCVRQLTSAFADGTRKVDFFHSNYSLFTLNLLVQALGLDHHAALLIFCPNSLKEAKTEGVSSNSAIYPKPTPHVK